MNKNKNWFDTISGWFPIPLGDYLELLEYTKLPNVNWTNDDVDRFIQFALDKRLELNTPLLSKKQRVKLIKDLLKNFGKPVSPETPQYVVDALEAHYQIYEFTRGKFKYS